MKKYLLLLPIIFFAQTCFGAITTVQIVNGTSSVCSHSTCTLTVAATTAGDLGVVMVTTADASNQISSVSGGGTWTANGACKSTVVGSDTDIAYNLNLSGGATTITVTISNNYSDTVSFAEYKGGTWSVDGSCQTLNNQAATNYPTGPSITTTGADDVIVETSNIGAMHYSDYNTASGTGWTSPFDFFFPGPAFSNTQSAGDDALNVGPGTYQVTYHQDFAPEKFAASEFAFTSISVSSYTPTPANLFHQFIFGNGFKFILQKGFQFIFK